MFEEFCGFERTPFCRDIPTSELYRSSSVEETLSRLSYVAERQLFCVVTGECCTAKTTTIRRFTDQLYSQKYTLMYLADSKMTSRNFYKGMLDQIGAESKYYRGETRGNSTSRYN